MGKQIHRFWHGEGGGGSLASKKVAKAMVLNQILGLLGAAFLCVAAVHGAGAQVEATWVAFPGPDGVILSGVMYRPSRFGDGSSNNYSAVVMMHGCTGIWSNRDVNATNKDGTPNLQNHIEKWGLQLAEHNIVALAVDSFTLRRPADAPSREWQKHCSGSTYAGSVDPDTTRVQDARAAWAYLDAMTEVNGASIALLGWSQGAEASMVEAAETIRDNNTLRLASDHLFVGVVSFYPGCGPLLGFGYPEGSFWRPRHAMQLHVGQCDGFYDNCVTRSSIAVASPYSKSLLYPLYRGAAHSFDAVLQAWPSSTCRIPESGDECASRIVDPDAAENYNECAMRSADIAALDYFLELLPV